MYLKTYDYMLFHNFHWFSVLINGNIIYLVYIIIYNLYNQLFYMYAVIIFTLLTSYCFIWT